MQNQVILEMASVEEATRLLKIDKLEILGMGCKINWCAESMFGTDDDLTTKMQSA